MKSIAIIGQGHVGIAVREGMRHAFSIWTYDKKYPDIVYIYKRNSDSVRDYDYPDNPHSKIADNVDGPIFICVPTPMKLDGSCDVSIVKEVVFALDRVCSKGKILVIKSTVIPGTTERLNKTCKNVQVCFNPEFLTERNAIEDFKNQDRIIIGGPRPGSSILKQVYMQAYPNIPVTKTGSTTAEMVKYLTNCFLATKVSFANEMKQICDELDIDYDKVIEYATKDKRLGDSHWAVPGPVPAADGSGRLLRGFSGACFNKDLNALIAKAKELGVDPKVMKAVWDKNLEVRPERDWENLKGRAVV